MDGGPPAESMSVTGADHEIIRAAYGGNERGLRKLCRSHVEALIGRLLHSVSAENGRRRHENFQHISQRITVLVSGRKKILIWNVWSEAAWMTGSRTVTTGGVLNESQAPAENTRLSVPELETSTRKRRRSVTPAGRCCEHVRLFATSVCEHIFHKGVVERPCIWRGICVPKVVCVHALQKADCRSG